MRIAIPSFLVGLSAWGLLASVGAGFEKPEAKSVDRDQAKILASVLGEIQRLADLPFPSPKEREDHERMVVETHKVFDDEPATFLWLGDLFERKGEFAKANQAWQDGLTKKSTLLPGEEKAARAELFLRLAYLDLARNEIASAVALAEKSIAQVDTDVRPYQLLFDVSLRTGKVVEAVAATKRAHERFQGAPAGRPFVRLYFEALTRIGDWEQLASELLQMSKERELDADVLYFQAMLANQQGNLALAFSRCLLAGSIGGGNNPSTQKAKEFVDKLSVRSELDLEEPLRWLVSAYTKHDRPEFAEAAPALLDKVPTKEPHIAWAVERMRTICLATRGQIEPAIAQWRKWLDKWPGDVAAMCYLGELLEGAGGSADAADWFIRARKLEPTNTKVRQIFRMGGTFKLTDDGVEVIAVEKLTPYQMFGLQPGDVLLRLDSEKLATLKPIERMRAVRLFQGGDVEYRRAGMITSREMELALFKN